MTTIQLFPYNKKLLRSASMLLLISLAFACGRDKDRSARESRDAEVGPGLGVTSALAGTYQDAENGQARIQIDGQNIVVGTTLEIPSPAGDGTRLTPRFPQPLVYDAAKGYFSTIGTYNDGQGAFKNIELRVRLYQNNQYLDVTLLLPPDEALQGQLSTTLRSKQHDEPAQNEKPCQKNHKPGDCHHKPGDGDCPTCPEPQLIYVYRFKRIA